MTNYHFAKSTSSILRKSFFPIFLTLTLLLFTACENNRSIIGNVDEREANMIVVLLESRGIRADKEKMTSSDIGGDSAVKYQIMVSESNAVDAMAFLNQNGLPRRQGTNLLQLFAKQGLMSTDKEETIRYQAGLAQQINNIILMIDGVIDSSVQLSFPPETQGMNEEKGERITSAVYVKHQGVIDDPNIHLENKIKRIVSGSVTGLDINDVTVVSDRSRFTDVTVTEINEKLGASGNEYVSIWSIVMDKSSAGKFRFLFFTITFFAVVFAILVIWLAWKIYPALKKRGLKEIVNPVPIAASNKETPPPGKGTTK